MRRGKKMLCGLKSHRKDMHVCPGVVTQARCAGRQWAQIFPRGAGHGPQPPGPPVHSAAYVHPAQGCRDTHRRMVRGTGEARGADSEALVSAKGADESRGARPSSAPRGASAMHACRRAHTHATTHECTHARTHTHPRTHAYARTITQARKHARTHARVAPPFLPKPKMH